MEIESLLEQVKSLIRESDKVREFKGLNFNVFNVCGVRSSELVHSRFIAEFLSPQGSHDFGDVFLQLFCKQLNIPLVDYYSCKVVTELAVEQGRLDIVIKPKSEAAIVIENKIYAGDQEKQLQRYRDWLDKIYEKNSGVLLYLTIYGHHSPEAEKSNVNYRPISYANDILAWIDECIKVAVEKPFVRETLQQYKNLIKELTNQSLEKLYMEELFEKMTKSLDNIKAADYIASNYGRALNNLITDKLKSIISDEDILKCCTGKDLTLTMGDVEFSGTAIMGFNYKIPNKNYWIRFAFENFCYKKMAYGLITDNANINKYIEKYKAGELSVDATYDYPGKNPNNWMISKYLKGYENLACTTFIMEHWDNGNFTPIKDKIIECIQELYKIIAANPEVL